MASNRVRLPNSGATLNEDKPDPCEVKGNKGTRKQKMNTSSIKEAMKKNLYGNFGLVVGAIIAPLLGFAFSGYHLLSSYVDNEKGAIFALFVVGAILGAIAGKIYYVVAVKANGNKDK